ncbi:hypothetical protein C8R42DRAFT_657802 [Lentinula raphanica]|nr:hypothetical protein C8R42DRAFT_657802 [Lentinula raphanica]
MDPWASTTSNNANKAHSRAPSKAPSAKARSTFSVSPSTPPPNDPEPSSTLAKAHSRAPSLAPSRAPSRAASVAPPSKARSTLSVSHTPPNEPEPTREPEPEDGAGAGAGSGQPPLGQESQEGQQHVQVDTNANVDADLEATKNESEEKAKAKAKAGEEPEDEPGEPDTDTELLPKDASPSEKLSVSLDLLREIEGLRAIMGQGGDDDKQISKKIRKLERRVERVSCKNPSWSTSPSKAYRYEMITNQNQGISDIKQRLWEILTFTPSTPNHPGAAAPASDYLDITFPKAWKGPKAKSVRGAVIEALEEHGLETEEDPNNGRVLRVPIPFRGED